MRSGNLLFIAGKAPLPENGKLPKGRLGSEFTAEDGYRFARSAALDLIAVMRTELGSLDKVVRVVEVQGFLNAVPEFEDHAKVLNGCSDLLVEVFGERGIHARPGFRPRLVAEGLPPSPQRPWRRTRPKRKEKRKLKREAAKRGFVFF